MILVKQLDSFKIKNFDGKIYDNNGDLVIAGFSVVAPVSYTGTVLNRFKITVTDHLIEKGDVIFITGSDGIEKDYIVDGVGESTILMNSMLIDLAEASEVSIRTDMHKITLTTLEEGQYTLSDNEALIVANTFADLFISKASIKLKYRNLDEETNIELLNNDAKESVIADFSFDATFYKKVDLGQLKELQKRKIQVILTGDLKEATDSYNLLFKEVVSYLNTKNDNTVNNDITTATTLASDDDLIGWGS